MPPKRRHPSSAASLASLRKVIAQRFAPTAALTGAPEDDAAPPPLEIQPLTTASIAAEQSYAMSTNITGRSFRRSIRCKTGGTLASTSTSTSATRTRGIVVGKKTHEEVRKKRKKIPVAWSDELKLSSDVAGAMRDVVAASVASFEASNLTPLPMEGDSDSTSSAPIVLPLETHIDIVQEEVGVRRGTTIGGLGSAYRRDPLARGSAQPASATSEDLRSTIARLEEEVEEQRRYRAEQQKVIEEMQNQLRAILRRNGTGGKSTSTQQQP